MAVNPKDVITKADKLKGERRSLESEWQDVADLISPRRADFTRKSFNSERPAKDILDSTGRQAHRFLSAACNSMLTSGRWFGITVDDYRVQRDRASRIWLEAVTDILYDLFASPVANFVGNMDELYQDLTGYGSAGMMIRHDPYMPTPVLFSTRPLRELYLGENCEGRVDTVIRDFDMAAREAVTKWGAQAGAMANKLAQKEETAGEKLGYIHACYPRADRRSGVMGAKNMPYASVVVTAKDAELVNESGYESSPWIIARWAKMANSAYGEGAGMVAAPDLNMLQRMMRVTIRAGEKMIDPALMIPDDGVIGPTLRTGPSKTNVIRADLLTGRESPIRAMPTGGNPELGEEMMKSARERVQAAFYYQLLQVMQDPKMTATQVLQLAEEVRRILGPVFGRLETELLGPTIGRTLDVLSRLPGVLPPMPPLLQQLLGRGAKLKIEYISPIARAMRAAEGDAILRTLDAVRIIAQTDPAVMDNYDLDLAARKLGDILGAPQDIQRASAVVIQMRAARQQVADAQHTAALAEQASRTIAPLAKAMPDNSQQVAA